MFLSSQANSHKAQDLKTSQLMLNIMWASFHQQRTSSSSLCEGKGLFFKIFFLSLMDFKAKWASVQSFKQEEDGLYALSFSLPEMSSVSQVEVPHFISRILMLIAHNIWTELKQGHLQKCRLGLIFAPSPVLPPLSTQSPLPHDVQHSRSRASLVIDTILIIPRHPGSTAQWLKILHFHLSCDLNRANRSKVIQVHLGPLCFIHH